MPVFTVHGPLASDGSADTDRFVFVRDGFHFWAFLLGPLWLFWHRLWVMLVIYIAVVASIIAVMIWLRTGTDTGLLVALLVALLTGYEAASGWRWSLSRGRWHELGVVVADDEESAERRFFARWAGEEGAGERGPPPAAPAAPRASSGAARDVIGLFPQPGAPR
jgi:Protein of unknown function (DUF2628)